MKFWKIASLTVISILILALGAAVILAQEVEEAPPTENYNYGDMMGDAETYGDMMGDNGGYGYMMGDPGDYGDMMGDNGNYGGMMGGGMMGGFMHEMMDVGTLYDVAAEALGITVDEVWAELANGISLADLAASYGVDIQDIIDTFVAEHEAAFTEAVAEGYLTQEQADWMLAHMTENIAFHVTQPYGMGGGMMGGGMMGNGAGNGMGGGMMGGGMGNGMGGFGNGQRGMGNFAPQGTAG